MAVLVDFIATPASKKVLGVNEIFEFVKSLLHELHFPLPAAILIGEAKNTDHNNYWLGPNESYITPNSPGSMLELRAPEFPQELIWYYGDDETAFFQTLRAIPLGEKDCCISFPAPQGKLLARWEGGASYEDTSIDGWDGATIYLLTCPFLLDWPSEAIWKGNTSFDRSVQHFFSFHSLTGGGIVSESLQMLLASYFGPDLLMGEVYY